MHEVGIMSSAIETVLAQTREHGASRVHLIVLRIGALSGVQPEALRFAFDVVTKDTLAEGATLEIDTVPARARCPDCELDFEPDSSFIFTCPRCSRICGELAQGRELELARIEVS
jgi:hydrogenase nickel incorporation protein HypA/HybF